MGMLMIFLICIDCISLLWPTGLAFWLALRSCSRPLPWLRGLAVRAWLAFLFYYFLFPCSILFLSQFLDLYDSLVLFVLSFGTAAFFFLLPLLLPVLVLPNTWHFLEFLVTHSYPAFSVFFSFFFFFFFLL